MKNFSRIAGIMSVIVFIMVFIVGPSGAIASEEKVIKWKCQTHWPASSPSFKGSMLVIKKQVEDATEGRLVIEPYIEGALVPSNETFNAVSRGMIQMGSAAGGYFQNRVPLAGIAGGLPYSFKNLYEALYFHKNLGFEKMMQEACAKHGVFYVTDNVYRTEVALKKPVKTLADFKGLKIRSMGSLAVFLTELGAASSYIPGSEIYTAMASGVIDGAHWGAAQGAKDMGFYDTCKYHMKPALSISGQTCFVTNQKAIDKLPKDVRNAFISVMERHYLERATEYETLEALALAEAEEKHKVQVVEILPEEQKKITQIAMKLWDKEAAKSPENAKAVELAKDFLKKLGYI